ncbi:phage antirepressor [Ruminococcus intestinalis]|uniref:phage antirepressor n=1 Tax=Ruminococcus intestinalis TaxID=2763066 RepID=UPI003F7F85B8
MENRIKIFENAEFGKVRVNIVNNEPMFCLGDVCKVLGLTQPSKVKERLNEKGVNTIPTLTPGGTQELLYINESNLYKAIFQSRKECAERFSDWVTSEVLPSIRKNGGYIMEKQDETPEELMARALMIAQETLKRKEQRLLEAEAKIKENAPKVEFYNAVTGSEDTIDMRTVATVLNMGIGRNKIFEVLRDKRVLDRKNMPYQKYIDLGYFRTVETQYTKSDGTNCINIKTVVFQKGVDFIRKTLTLNK